LPCFAPEAFSVAYVPCILASAANITPSGRPSDAPVHEPASTQRACLGSGGGGGGLENKTHVDRSGGVGANGPSALYQLRAKTPTGLKKGPRTVVVGAFSFLKKPKWALPGMYELLP